MKWNNGKRRAEFEREHNQAARLYKEAGMSDEQIGAMYDYDLAVFNSDRREAEHTQRYDFTALYDGPDDESRNPLCKKFAAMTSDLDLSRVSRYSWTEEVENEDLAKALKNMPQGYLELLTMLVMDDMTQTEIAEQCGVVKSAISNKLERIRKNFRKYLKSA